MYTVRYNKTKFGLAKIHSFLKCHGLGAADRMKVTTKSIMPEIHNLSSMAAIKSFKFSLIC
jgi:hypothetical protein